jgi:uncharacterized membrane protein YqaE (UPF0057 family)
MALTCSDICKFLAALLLPPLGVFFEVGCTADLVINILLTILGFIPGKPACIFTCSKNLPSTTEPIALCFAAKYAARLCNTLTYTVCCGRLDTLSCMLQLCELFS